MASSSVKMYTVRDMFNFWVRNQRNLKPYLIYKYPNRNKNSELWYEVKSEINYCENKLLELDALVQKLEPSDREISRFTSTTKEIFEAKKDIYNLRQNIEELKKESPKSKKLLMDFYTFRDVVFNYNKRVVDNVIKGNRVNLSERLGYMYISKIKKVSKLINWKASNDYKAELIAKGETPKDKVNLDGKNWLIYYSNPFYFRWTWQKRNGICKVKNHTVYGFYPTNKSSKGVPGAKSQLVAANKKNPLLHLNYITR